MPNKINKSVTSEYTILWVLTPCSQAEVHQNFSENTFPPSSASKGKRKKNRHEASGEQNVLLGQYWLLTSITL
jgi:hypothetical protein